MGSTTEDRFYQLDNSAVFTAAVAGTSGPFVFRLSCEFDETVRLAELSASLAALRSRFPFLFVSLRHGVFWHYLDPLHDAPRVEREKAFPALPMRYRRGRPLLRVTAYGRRIACEFHHAITDGTGALAFLRALVVEYLDRLGVGAELEGEARRAALSQVPRPGDPHDSEEEEDSYDRFFRKEAPLPGAAPRAFMLPGKRFSRAYRETVARVPLDRALAEAKALKVTITELLAAVHLAALQDVRARLPPRARRRARPVLSVQVPVNLRKLYPSRTLRNFFLFVAPEADLRLGSWSFDELLRRVHHALRLGLEKKELLRQLRRNVGGERNPAGRVIFLPLKTIVLRAINAAIGAGSYSGSLSNLGAVELPEPYASRVRRFGFLPSRAKPTGANIGALSWRGELVVCIGSLIESPDFERAFFSRLASLGLPVTVESSRNFGEGSVP